MSTPTGNHDVCECGGSDDSDSHSATQCSDDCYCGTTESFAFHTPTGCGDTATALSLVTAPDPAGDAEPAGEMSHQSTESDRDEDDWTTIGVGVNGTVRSTRPPASQREPPVPNYPAESIQSPADREAYRSRVRGERE